MYKLCTTEKPSVAKDIARVIGATERKNGYYIGNGYIVTWAVGHLVGLAEPEEYGYVCKDDLWNRDKPEFKEKAYSELPLFPKNFKTIVLEPTKEQFEIMKNLMHRDDVDYIIDCGDMGAEGHILQWLIREKAGCTKLVKRFCATSMTDEAIKASMASLRDAREFERVIMGEYCKKRADWILGMSMSRCASIKYNARVDVGRVQSPTLYFIVKRFIEVNNFKSHDYYQFQAELFEGFTVIWSKDKNNNFELSQKDNEDRLIDKACAEQTVKKIMSLKTGVISALEFNKKAVDRPQLYDITELQRDGNRLYGYTASEVLETAQTLYETYKVLSYPRTDSRYITSDLEPYMISRIKQISTLDIYKDTANQICFDGLNIDKKIVDDSKVTDHHAMIVTEKIENFDMSALKSIEQNILHLVITRMLVAFSEKYTYDETLIDVTFNDMIFSASGKKPISLGWKAIQKSLMSKSKIIIEDLEDEKEQIFPSIQKGQIVNIKDLSVLSKKTTAPKLHTEATLLTAMENAGTKVEGGSILKGKGIGTQATRAAIIKSLFDKKYVATKQIGKTNYLMPTKQGINTIKVLPPDLYSPKITADWENKISQIVSGTSTENSFLDEFEKFIQEKVNQVKSSSVAGDFTYEREVFAKCPWCKGDVYKGKVTTKANQSVDSYYCSEKCGFSLQKNNIIFVSRTKKNLTDSQVKNLIEKGSIIATCLSKNEVKYKAQFKISKNDKGFTSLDFEFVNEKKSKK